MRMSAPIFFILTLFAALIGFTDMAPSASGVGRIAFVVFALSFVAAAVAYVFLRRRPRV